MTPVARTFDHHSQNVRLRTLPPPADRPPNDEEPWGTQPMEAMPLMMFQLRFRDGSFRCFQYGDVRQIHCRDAGHVEITLQALEPLLVTITGRRLRELAGALSFARVRWLREADPRAAKRSEESPEIVGITIERIEMKR